jgi:hypothetical protein
MSEGSIPFLDPLLQIYQKQVSNTLSDDWITLVGTFGYVSIEIAIQILVLRWCFENSYKSIFLIRKIAELVSTGFKPICCQDYLQLSHARHMAI